VRRIANLVPVVAVAIAVIAAAELPAVVGAHWPEPESWRVARWVKYITDGAAHAILLAVVLYYAQRVTRGLPLIALGSISVYGMLHGTMQAVCGYAAYFTNRPAVAGAGGLCERAGGWEPIALLVAVLIGFCLVFRCRRGRE
jgi:hypothetical protein